METGDRPNNFDAVVDAGIRGDPQLRMLLLEDLREIALRQRRASQRRELARIGRSIDARFPRRKRRRRSGDLPGGWAP